MYGSRHTVGKYFMLPIVRSNALKITAIYRDMQEWNQLPKHISQITVLEICLK